jgi:hypothetical protein
MSSASDLYVLLAKKVQWHRARADMMRWVEEVEILEEEFRRLIRALEKMSSVWKSISESPTTGVSLKYPTTFDLSTAPHAGQIAYASRKAAIYQKMVDIEREQFKKTGGQWPAENESLSDHVLGRRPALTVDWDAVGRDVDNGDKQSLDV